MKAFAPIVRRRTTQPSASLLRPQNRRPDASETTKNQHRRTASAVIRHYDFANMMAEKAWKMADAQLDETQIRFQEAVGARLFRQGKPRAALEVKSVDTPLAFHDARLRGYNRAKAAAASAPRKRRRTKAERREKGDRCRDEITYKNRGNNETLERRANR